MKALKTIVATAGTDTLRTGFHSPLSAASQRPPRSG